MTQHSADRDTRLTLLRRRAHVLRYRFRGELVGDTDQGESAGRPAQAATPVVPTPKESATDAGAGAAVRVLVVDGDDTRALRSIDLLERAGYEVVTADLPDIGLVRRAAPRAIVLGLLYRGQAAGLDFLERHAADPQTAAIPVVVCAGAAELDASQWRRLVALAPPVVAAPDAASGLVAEVRRLLTPRASE